MLFGSILKTSFQKCFETISTFVATKQSSMTVIYIIEVLGYFAFFDVFGIKI